MDMLTKVELDIFHLHSIHAEAILSGMAGLRIIAKSVRSHQKYLNGRDYPDKLNRDDIPLGSKIICVASDFKKLESNRLLKKYLTQNRRLSTLKKCQEQTTTQGSWIYPRIITRYIYKIIAVTYGHCL
jgi:response regulator RpfG family c-di-GMP phosphodiesterase